MKPKEKVLMFTAKEYAEMAFTALHSGLDLLYIRGNVFDGRFEVAKYGVVYDTEDLSAATEELKNIYDSLNIPKEDRFRKVLIPIDTLKTKLK